MKNNLNEVSYVLLNQLSLGDFNKLLRLNLISDVKCSLLCGVLRKAPILTVVRRKQWRQGGDQEKVERKCENKKVHMCSLITKHKALHWSNHGDLLGWEGLGLRCKNWKVQQTFTHAPWHVDCWPINRRRVCLYINGGIKTLSFSWWRPRRLDQRWSTAVFLPRRYASGVPVICSDVLRRLPQPSWFFKVPRTTRSICLIPIMETNKCLMSKSLRNSYHWVSRPTKHNVFLDFAPERLTLWISDPACTEDSWSQLYALHPRELHSP